MGQAGMGTPTLTQVVKNFMIAHVQSKRQEESCFCLFRHALVDYESLAFALKACDQDITGLNLAMTGFTSSFNELEFAMGVARL